MPESRARMAVAGTVAACALVLSIAVSTSVGVAGAAGPVPATEQLVVRFRPDAPLARRSALLDRVGVDPRATLPGATTVARAPAGAIDDAVRALDASPLTLYAEAVQPTTVLALPNDPLIRDANAWGLARIGAPAAWERTRGSSSVVVALLDTGVSAAHEDLTGAIAPGGVDLVNGDADPADDNGHGTAVAGVVAARADNRAGVAGVCPACRILPVKVADASGAGTSVTLAQGIDHAVAHGADVVNLSLALAGPSQVVQDAVDRATAAGVLVVAAAGNDGGSTPTYPAAYAGVVGVGATGAADERLPWSQAGSWVTLTAPGVAEAPLASGRYGARSGTSMAAAYVAGAAGLALALDPATAPAAMRAALMRSAAPTTPSSVSASGRLDVAALLGTVAPGGASPALVVPPTVSGTPMSGYRLVRGAPVFRNATTFSFRWERCTGPGTGCLAIAGETGPTYTTTDADVGFRIGVRATAANPFGVVDALSPTTTPVQAVPVPTATAPPVLTGTAGLGAPLRTSTGTWAGIAGSAVMAIGWERCDAAGAGCTTIPGAVGPVRVVQADDIGARLRSVVTVTASGRRGTAASGPSAVVGQVAAPVLRSRPPAIGGAAVEDGTVTVAMPTFEYAPRTPTIEWQRCAADGSGCATIAGATELGYRLTAADVGSAVRVRFVATGPGGTTEIVTDPLGSVRPAAPTAVRPPGVSGPARVGETLAVVDGSSAHALATELRWQRCTAPPVCLDIPGATGRSYTATLADQGQSLRVVAVLIGAPGAPVVASPSSPTARVQPAALPATLAVTLMGAATAGNPLRLRFEPIPGATIVYAWRRCAATCTAIPGQMGIAYTPTRVDVGYRIVGVVQASTSVATATYETDPTPAIR